jgi:hypothetical protein
MTCDPTVNSAATENNPVRGLHINRKTYPPSSQPRQGLHVSGLAQFPSCIAPSPVIARSEATWQSRIPCHVRWIATSLRSSQMTGGGCRRVEMATTTISSLVGAKRRGNPVHMVRYSPARRRLQPASPPSARRRLQPASPPSARRRLQPTSDIKAKLPLCTACKAVKPYRSSKSIR